VHYGTNYPSDGGNWAGKDEVSQNASVDLTADFHTYGLEWSSTSQTWYVDDAPIGTVTAHVLTTKPHWVMLQVAIDGGIGTDATTTNQAMEVDWVRVHQLAAGTGLADAGGGGGAGGATGAGGASGAGGAKGAGGRTGGGGATGVGGATGASGATGVGGTTGRSDAGVTGGSRSTGGAAGKAGGAVSTSDGGNASSDEAGAPAADEASGCACRTPARTTGSAWWLAALGLAAALRRRRGPD
jgi:MYXO-CTERM domain-containing protein